MSSIEEYLAALRAQLAGADPAVVQDALYDAEEYLRSEIAAAPADPEALANAIDAYGTPEEVAAAYLESERTVAAALRRPEPREQRSLLRRFFGVIVDPTAYGALFYMFLALFTGIVYFTIVTTGVSLSLGLMVLIIGLPFALLVLGVVRAVSFAEGRLVEALFGERMPRRPRVVPQEGNLFDRIKAWVTDWRTWTTMLYMVLQLPLGVIYFSLFTGLLATAAAFVATPIFQVFEPNHVVFMAGDYGYRIAPWFMPFMVAAGVLLFFVTLHLAKALGKAHAAYAKVMLVGRPETGAAAAAPVQAAS